MLAFEPLELLDVNQLPLISKGPAERVVLRAPILQLLRSRERLRLLPTVTKAAQTTSFARVQTVRVGGLEARTYGNDGNIYRTAA